MNAPAKFFDTRAPVAFAGKDAGQTPAFRWYDKDRIVQGRRLEDHLRFAVNVQCGASGFFTFVSPNTPRTPWVGGSSDLIRLATRWRT